MTSRGRPASCSCDECPKCKQRIYMKAWWNAKPIEERRAIIARRDRESARAADRKRYRANREKHRLAADRWAAANPEKVREAKYKNRRHNPEKATARQAVQREIAAGRMARLPCQRCADPRTHAHHPDYSKPLEVMWLCPRHHGEEHTAMRELERAA